MGRIDIDLSFPSYVQSTKLPPKATVEAEHVEYAPTETASDSSHNLEAVQAQIFPFRPRARSADLPFIDASEVAKRDGASGNRLWIVVNDVVLDCTEFKSKHPAGKAIIEGFGGYDCTWQWWSFHSQQIMQKYGKALQVARTVDLPNKYDRPVRKPFELPMAGDQW